MTQTERLIGEIREKCRAIAEPPRYLKGVGGTLPDLPGGFYRVSQGREVGHDAIIELGIDDAGDVWSGGRAVAVVTGHLDWPA